MNNSHRIAQLLEMPGETVFRLPVIQWTGRDRIFIQNHTGVVDYNPEALAVNTSQGLYKIEGEQLYLETLSKDTLVLRGQISGVYLCAKARP